MNVIKHVDQVQARTRPLSPLMCSFVCRHSSEHRVQEHRLHLALVARLLQALSAVSPAQKWLEGIQGQRQKGKAALTRQR